MTAREHKKNFLALHREIGEAVLKLCHSADEKKINPREFTEQMLNALILTLALKTKNPGMRFVRDELVGATNRALVTVYKVLKPRRKRKSGS